MAERLACGGGGLVFLGKLRHVSGHLFTKAPSAEWQATTSALFHQNLTVMKGIETVTSRGQKGGDRKMREREREGFCPLSCLGITPGILSCTYLGPLCSAPVGAAEFSLVRWTNLFRIAGWPLTPCP